MNLPNKVGNFLNPWVLVVKYPVKTTYVLKMYV